MRQELSFAKYNGSYKVHSLRENECHIILVAVMSFLKYSDLLRNAFSRVTPGRIDQDLLTSPRLTSSSRSWTKTEVYRLTRTRTSRGNYEYNKFKRCKFTDVRIDNCTFYKA